MKPGSYAIGIDLGGTSVKGARVRSGGSIDGRTSSPTPATGTPASVIEMIASTVEQLLNGGGGAACEGVGIGSPGMVSGGEVRDPPNLSGWVRVDLAGELGKKFDLPVVVENDANAAALGESRFGAGRDLDDFIFVIWGTGIGGGLIVDRKIYRGPHGGAGEIGHMSIDMNGPLCGCGNRGCIEAYVGQKYLSERARTLIAGGPASSGAAILSLVKGDASKIDPAVLSKAAEAGDRLAADILTEAGRYLGMALSSVVNILDIRVAIVGGGVSAVGDFVFKAALETLRSRVMKPHKEGARIIRASLGNDAGILGAASLVLHA